MSFPILTNFEEDEFDHPDEMDDRTLYLLDSLVYFVKSKHPVVFVVNSSFRPGDPKWHGRGKAVDGYFKNKFTNDPMPVLQQFLYASRFLWGGIGLYPHWNNPGLHLDTRPRTIYQPMATWYKNEKGEYLAIDYYRALKAREGKRGRF